MDVLSVLDKAITEYQKHPFITFERHHYSLLKESIEGYVRVVRIGQGPHKLVSVYGVHGDERASIASFSVSPFAVLGEKLVNAQYVGILANETSIRNGMREVPLDEFGRIDLNRNFGPQNGLYGKLGLTTVLERILQGEAESTEGLFVLIDHHDTDIQGGVHAVVDGVIRDGVVTVKYDNDAEKWRDDALLVMSSALRSARRIIGSGNGPFFREPVSDPYWRGVIAPLHERLRTLSGFVTYHARRPHCVTLEVPMRGVVENHYVLNTLMKPLMLMTGQYYPLKKRVRAHVSVDMSVMRFLNRLSEE